MYACHLNALLPTFEGVVAININVKKKNKYCLHMENIGQIDLIFVCIRQFPHNIIANFLIPNQFFFSFYHEMNFLYVFLNYPFTHE